MELKKGMFFTMDSILAAGIMLIVIILTSSSYVKQQPTFQLDYMSQDIISTLSELTVEDVNSQYVAERISSGDITNLDNTILEQVVEFWVDDELEYANKTISNVTGPFVGNITGFGVWIDNETIYTRDLPLTKSLISSKKIISGITKGQSASETRKYPPILFGPVTFEVRTWQ